MSGYRECGEAPPKPLTGLQRAGIACMYLSAAIIFAYLGGQFGLIPKWVGSPIAGAILAVMGGPLMSAGARRDPPSPETRRRRILIVFAGVAVCVLTAAATFYFAGAH